MSNKNIVYTGVYNGYKFHVYLRGKKQCWQITSGAKLRLGFFIMRLSIMILFFFNMLAVSDKVKGEMEKKEIQNYIMDLQSDNTKLRRKAAFELGKIGDKRAVPYLIKTLEDRDVYVRSNAICALGELRDKNAVSALLERFGKEDRATMRCFIIGALSQIDDERAIPFFLKILKEEEVDVKGGVVYYLGEKRIAGAVPLLIETYYKDSDITLQREIMLALHKLKDERALPLLLDAVRNTNSLIRMEAVNALGSWGKEKPLLEVLKQEKDIFVRQGAIRYLGEMKSKKSIPILIQILKDNNENLDTRYGAAEALADLNEIEMLIESLGNKDVDVRYASSFALAKRKDPRAIPILIEAMRNKDLFPIVRAGAIKYLKERFIEQISPEVRKEIEDIIR
ncbi:MAG: HEAT repeat domain-containing protein [Candidatus Omnitrophota bacterium]